jgi:hypothetical protein
MKAGSAGQGDHIHWLDCEDTIYRALEYQYWENKAGVIPIGHYYEFGLLEGESFSLCYRILTELARDLGHASVKELGVGMCGFDSFEGMPEPREADHRAGWTQGSMRCSREKFELYMDSQGVPRDIYQIFEGFYDKSLTEELRARLASQKPSLVLMDCGFYSSTMTVLEWLRPMLRDGTLFIFFGRWAYMGHPDFGELRAIRDFNAKGSGLLVPHYFGGATQQVYVFTTGYQGAAYKDYLALASPTQTRRG